MKNKGMTKTGWIALAIGLLLAASCTRVAPEQVQAAYDPATNSDRAGFKAQPVQPPAITLPAGTRFRVRLLETLDTRRNRSGDQFTASLDEPLVSGDRVVVPKGTVFQGRVTEAKPSGRVKGRAVLALRLDSFALDGQTYLVSSDRSARVSAGHKKHNILWIGGSSGGGAVIGAIAGGGVGALIGSGAGAAAGTVGSAITGKRNVTLPVETVITFSFQSPVSVG
jgi:hypothetical protein